LAYILTVLDPEWIPYSKYGSGSRKAISVCECLYLALVRRFIDCIRYEKFLGIFWTKFIRLRSYRYFIPNLTKQMVGYLPFIQVHGSTVSASFTLHWLDPQYRDLIPNIIHLQTSSEQSPVLRVLKRVGGVGGVRTLFDLAFYLPTD